MPTTDIHKKRAHWKVAQAIKSGKLVRQPCISCGRPDAQAHHEDYNKPLDVTWLCVTCHNQIKHAVTPERVAKRRQTMEAKGGYHKHDDTAKKAIAAASASRTRTNETRRRTSEAIKEWWARRRQGND